MATRKKWCVLRKRRSGVRRGAVGVALFAAGWILVCPVQAQVVSSVPEQAAPSDMAPAVASGWFVRGGVVAALYDSHATFAISGQEIPGATAHVRNNVTALFDLGYNVSQKFSLVMMVGFPPRTAVEGRGTIAPLGTLGAVQFGPVFLTGVYRLPKWAAIEPYIGAGGAYTFILKNYDGYVTHLNVHDNSGFVLQAGFEYSWSESWGAFIDYKRLWLSLDAEGLIADTPVTARVTLDPNLISVGVRYQFQRR